MESDRNGTLFRNPAGVSCCMTKLTRILESIERGDSQATEQVLPLVYDELRKLAARMLARETPGQTLVPTALVHEAYVRLVNVEEAQHWQSRRHFFAAAAESMRRILVERARRNNAASTAAASAVNPWSKTRLRQSNPSGCWPWMRRSTSSRPPIRRPPNS